jgi:hypothetical protein
MSTAAWMLLPRDECRGRTLRTVEEWTMSAKLDAPQVMYKM